MFDSAINKALSAILGRTQAPALPPRPVPAVPAPSEMIHADRQPPPTGGWRGALTSNERAARSQWLNAQAQRGSTVNRAIDLMPEEQRRKLQELFGQGRVHFERFEEDEKLKARNKQLGLTGDKRLQLRGHYKPATGVHVNEALLATLPQYLAETLTHETTHALQNGAPIRKDLTPAFIRTSDPYRDHPLEVEARLAEGRIKRPR
jgi:hypothetical protein